MKFNLKVFVNVSVNEFVHVHGCGKRDPEYVHVNVPKRLHEYENVNAAAILHLRCISSFDKDKYMDRKCKYIDKYVAM